MLGLLCLLVLLRLLVLVPVGRARLSLLRKLRLLLQTITTDYYYRLLLQTITTDYY